MSKYEGEIDFEAFRGYYKIGRKKKMASNGNDRRWLLSGGGVYSGNKRGWLLSGGGGCSIWAGISLIFSGVTLLVSDEFLTFMSYIVSEVFPTYMGVPLIVLGIIAIVGGVSAIRRKSFGLSLAGAICALIPLNLLGLLAVIFVSLGKREF